MGYLEMLLNNFRNPDPQDGFDEEQRKRLYASADLSPIEAAMAQQDAQAKVRSEYSADPYTPSQLDPLGVADRRRSALADVFRSPSERALLASAAPAGTPQRNAQLGINPPQERQAMEPGEAMQRLIERKGGQVDPKYGYLSPQAQAHLGSLANNDSPDAFDRLYRSAMTDQAKTRATVNPDRAAELESRRSAVRERGIAKGKARRGVLPTFIDDDQMFNVMLATNPEIAGQIYSAKIGAGAEQGRLAALMQQNAAENQLQRDQLDLQRDELAMKKTALEQSLGQERQVEQQAAAAEGFALQPDPQGFQWTQAEHSTLDGKGGSEIKAYGLSQKWSREKIDRALQKYVGPYANYHDPWGYRTWWSRGLGSGAPAPGSGHKPEPLFGIPGLTEHPYDP